MPPLRDLATVATAGGAPAAALDIGLAARVEALKRGVPAGVLYVITLLATETADILVLSQGADADELARNMLVDVSPGPGRRIVAHGRGRAQLTSFEAV